MLTAHTVGKHAPARTLNRPQRSYSSRLTSTELGSGVVRDEGKAAELYRKAAEMGNAEAQTRFAEALFDGRGVARDPAGSRAWLEKAARQGNARAECDLGVMLTRWFGYSRKISRTGCDTFRLRPVSAMGMLRTIWVNSQRVV